MKRRTFLSAMGLSSIGLAQRKQSASAELQRPANGTTERIRLGQIGTGHAHASGKMASLRRSGDFEVVGIVEPDAELRNAAQEREVYRDLQWMSEEELLNVDGLQAIAVETEVKDLLSTAARAVAAGKHIHLDKPAGESLSKFKAILDDATRRGLTVQMGYMFRYNPAFQFCFKAVREGWVGSVFSIHTVMGKVLSPASRRELAPYRGGTMFELGCHVIDSVIKLMGRPEKVTPFSRSSSRLDDAFPDNQLAVLEYPGATVTVRSSIIEVEGFARRQFVVCGDEGTVDIRPLEPPHLRLALSRPRGVYKRGYQDIDVPDYRRYDADFADFAKIIRGEKESDFPPDHDLSVQETILRASGLPVT